MMMGGGHFRQALQQDARKARSTRRTLGRLLAYFRPYLLVLLGVAALLLLSSGVQAVRPIIIGQAIDCFIAPAPQSCALAGHPTRPDAGGLAQTMLFYAALSVVGALASGGQFYLMAYAGQRVLTQLRDDIFAQIHRLTLSYYDRNRAGDIMSRLTNDADTIAQAINASLIQVIGQALNLLGFVVAMVLLQPALSLIVLVILPLMFAVTIWFSNLARHAFRQTRLEMGAVNTDLEQSISGVREVQAFSREEENIERFREANAANRDANIRAVAITSALRPTLDVLGNVALALVTGVGGAFALSGQPLAGSVISIGVIVAFIRYVQRVNYPIQVIAQMWAQVQSAVAGAERMFAMLEEQPDIQDAPDAVDLPPVEGLVEFDNVSFAYNAGEPVLRHISLRAEPGQVVALVGPTGAGKTSIINLIGRFYDVTDGAVRIDGYDVRRVTRRSLRRQLGIVLQDTVLFSDTVANNIRYGRPEATDEEVMEAARLAHAHDFIMALPQGYQTVLGERGKTLSQGQRQLIAIARAALANPRILLLDEATSSVDTRTERLIQAALNRLLEGRTSFVVAHRLSTIRNADQVLVIQDGQIVERGTHESLLAAGGVYHDLYMSQFRRQAELLGTGNGRQAAAQPAPTTGD